MPQEYETVIGLEVHVELSTKTKIFCGCSTAFGGRPNSHTCPVCLGMPGTLPVLNRQVLEHAIAVGLSTHCEISRYSRFDRKNYFYPDNPQNYQISQLYLPICRNGFLDIETETGTKSIRIHEIHMEEDAGKLIHDGENNCTLVDYNRAGVPLIEIVTEPDMGNAEEVIAFLEKLRFIIQYLGAGDCKLQEGSMRADVNLSVRRVGESRLGTRTEMKNLGSFRAVKRAIASERRRQAELLEAGRSVIQETRRWDEAKETSYSMRSKEDTRDYRYFPDPDLVPICVEEGYIQKIRESLPEFRTEKADRFRLQYGIPDYDIEMITQSRYLADFFEETVALGAPAKKVSNWLMVEAFRLLKEKDAEPEDIRFTPVNFAKLIALVEEKTINSTAAKEIFEMMFQKDMDPAKYVEEHGFAMVSDEKLLAETITEVIARNPGSVADYHNGKERALGFLVGQTMKKMNGRANPAVVNRLLKELL